ncbi:MAG: GNAT family N-acetyltransferase [Armatimonadetes bacterium]|nr:GNAT family N-acetyltransferase [Armatimonadota bacterium]
MMLTIRVYTPADLPRLIEITLSTFQPVSIDANIEKIFGPVGGNDWKARKARAIEEDCEINPSGVFLAEAEGTVAGYITTVLDRRTLIGRIPNLAVDPGFQGQGIGHELITHALRYFRENGMAMAKIETLAQNERGQRLYPKMGFTEVARQVHYVMPLEPPG